MILHLVLCELAGGVGEETVEWMMRETKARLLKIPEVRVVRCGRALEAEDLHQFFFSVEVDNTDKLAAYVDDPIHGKFLAEVIQPHTLNPLVLDFEMEPGKDLRYA